MCGQHALKGELILFSILRRDDRLWQLLDHDSRLSLEANL